MATPTGFHRLPVARVDRLCADAVAVTFAVPDDLAGTYRFTAGQYLTLRLPETETDTDTGTDTGGGEQRRSYSICAPEGEAPRIGVRRVDAGRFSAWLVDRLAVGDEVEVGPPQGRFTPHVRAGEHHALVAAGSGITPVLSIAATVLAHPQTRVTLVYGNRHSDTVMFAEELADLKDRYPGRFQLAHVLSREPRDAEILGGRLDADRLAALLDGLVPVPAVAHWWLCGPLGMVTDAADVLAGFGVAPERVHRELFYVDAPPPAPVRADDGDDTTGAAGTVVLHGRTTAVTLPFAEPVLDGAARARSDLPFACRGGVCGTCRARVSAGEVRMARNFALEDEEVAAGYVLTCQSVPVSDAVTLDYDA